jgi:hypothetical protein
MDTFTIDRSGLAPLTFTGQLLCESDGQFMAGQERNRWHDLAVYKTESNKYVLSISYRTRWQGEIERDYADVLVSPEEVRYSLANYRPTQYVRGYPDGEHYRDKQERLLQQIQLDYDYQVSEILGSSPEFSETVD